MKRLLDAPQRIYRLAIEDRPGAIVLAEHAVDLHAELFSHPSDKLTALDALARDLVRMRRAFPEIATFLQRVDDYIVLAQEEFVYPALPLDPFSHPDAAVAVECSTEGATSPERSPTLSTGVQVKTMPAASSA
jgi:hypothetical protein